eukprot:TRINITY_DN23990_c0_g1_i1.p2 TRINITY_DN23990_c0_g1~~TRINITY_DN23990_c0_g1_i1.p2  ORF type:complete len:275 (-),score=59.89 TRINITY_DN23990_c0_g1_i1:51-875(-)
MAAVQNALPPDSEWELGRSPHQDELHSEDAEGFDRLLRSLDDFHFRGQLRTFAREHCGAFAAAAAEAASGEGHSHLCHGLHLQYRALFDAHIERFLRSEDIEVQDFLDYARQRSEAPAAERRGWNAFLAEITASEDYSRFAQLMSAAAAQQRAEADQAANSFELPEVGSASVALGAASEAVSDPNVVAAAEASVVGAADAAAYYYYYATDGQQYGPATAEDMARCWTSGLLDDSCLVFFPGLATWTPLAQLPDLRCYLGNCVQELIPPPPPLPG